MSQYRCTMDAKSKPNWIQCCFSSEVDEFVCYDGIHKEIEENSQLIGE